MRQFIIVHKNPTKWLPGYYFTGPIDSTKVPFKFKYKGQVLDGYFKNGEGLYFTKTLWVTFSLRAYHIQGFSEVFKWYHPCLIHGVNAFPGSAHDVITGYIRSSGIELICLRIE